jgi:hypothetical protein
VMRLFNDRSTYVYASCVYVTNAVFLACHTTKKAIPAAMGSPFSIVVPQVIGMSFLAIISWLAIRRTSSILERCVLVLTGLVSALSVTSALRKFGLNVPPMLVDHLLFVVLSWAAALLTLWRTLEVWKTPLSGSG